jgi:thioredoxin reductase (NADPH)
MPQATRVAIIGGGPIGLEISATLKRRGIDYLHFEAHQIGHTMMWWPPGTRWFSSNERISIAGVPLVTPNQEKATREQYLAYLRTVVQTLDLPVRTYEPVVDIDSESDGTFTLTTQPAAGQRQVRAEAVILATGGTDRPRLLGIPGEELPHVEHAMPDPHTFFRRRLLIVGGKNSAVEAALRCHHAGADVALSYRGEALPEKSIKYWMMPEMSGLLKSGRIEGHMRTTPVKITPDAVTLERRIEGQEPERFEVEADAVLMMIGYEQDNRLFRLAGVDLQGEQHSPHFDEATMQTNVPGLYVAGTAIGGTQSRYKVFLENCHVHAERIAAHLAGETADTPVPEFAQPES